MWHSYLFLRGLLRHRYQFHFTDFRPFAPDSGAFSTHGAHKRPHSYLYHILLPFANSAGRPGYDSYDMAEADIMPGEWSPGMLRVFFMGIIRDYTFFDERLGIFTNLTICSGVIEKFPEKSSIETCLYILLSGMLSILL